MIMEIVQTKGSVLVRDISLEEARRFVSEVNSWPDDSLIEVENAHPIVEIYVQKSHIVRIEIRGSDARV